MAGFCAGTEDDKSSYSEKQESEEVETGDIYKGTKNLVTSGGDVNSYERNLMLEEEMTAGAEKISIGNFREKFNIKRGNSYGYHDQTINGLPVPPSDNGYNGNEQVLLLICPKICTFVVG